MFTDSVDNLDHITTTIRTKTTSTTAVLTKHIESKKYLGSNLPSRVTLLIVSVNDLCSTTITKTKWNNNRYDDKRSKMKEDENSASQTLKVIFMHCLTVWLCWKCPNKFVFNNHNQNQNQNNNNNRYDDSNKIKKNSAGQTLKVICKHCLTVWLC